MTNQEIITRGELIRDETVTGANTAQRVGEAFVAIGENLSELEKNIGFLEWEDITFTSNNGLVSSVDGSISENADYMYTEIDLTNSVYSKLSFTTRAFTGNYGYGFFVRGVWIGTKTTKNETIDIIIPDGSTAFRLCWHKTMSQHIIGGKSKLITDKLQKQIDENTEGINRIDNKITDLYSKLGTDTYVDIRYTEIFGHVVDSDTGSLVETEGYASVEIQLSGTSFTKIKFKTWKYSGNRGYGFVFSDGHWEGVRTTTVQEIIVDIPTDAITFKTCWSTQTSWFSQKIEGCVEDSVIVNLQRQINDNVSSINGLNTSISDLSKKLGSDVWENIEFTANVGLVNSEDGTIDTTSSISSDYNYAIIDLSEGIYKKISFLPRKFYGYYGYGFVLSDGSWKGTRGTITSTTPVEIEIPVDAVTFKTCWYKTQNQEIKTLKTQDNYTNLQEQISELREEIENSSKEGYTFKPFTISVPDCKDIIPNLTVASLYQMWDELVEEQKICFNPTASESSKVYAEKYIKISDIGYDQSNTYKMRKVELGIQNGTNNTYDASYTPDIQTKKVIVCANIHGRAGDAHIPAYLMYWLAKFILENRDSNELAQWLLTNYYFVIIPIGNPWGFMQGTRYNSRNIDLNRNFDADFVPNADPYGTGITGGTTAASELETQNIQSVIDDNTDAWMYVDFHSQPEASSSSTWKRDRMQYLPKSTNAGLFAQCEKAREYARLVANDWIEVIGSDEGGMSKQYAIKKGIARALTLEAATWHPGEHRNENGSYVNFGPKAMTGAARLFLSLLRFEN